MIDKIPSVCGGRERIALRQRQMDKDVLQVRRVYHQVVFLGILLHLSHAVIFFFLDCPLTAFYNCFSVLFYLLMLWTTFRGFYRVTVACVHLEVACFAVINTLLGGWDMGLALFLIAVSSLVYFCPFDRKYIPYLFSVTEMGLFLWLRFHSQQIPPFYQHIPQSALTLLYLYSAVACFCIVLCAAFFSNISATVTNRRLQDENRNLTALANFDDLTGLMSRRCFLERVAQYAADVPLAISLGDIDDFKQINDTYGHTAGDYVLRTVSRLIGQSFSNQVLACRWGGEEFVFCFPDVAADQAILELQRLRKAVECQFFSFSGHHFSITLTLGLAAQGTVADIGQLISQADSRMYSGKLHGKNQLVTEDLPNYFRRKP